MSDNRSEPRYVEETLSELLIATQTDTIKPIIKSLKNKRQHTENVSIQGKKAERRGNEPHKQQMQQIDRETIQEWA